MIEDKGKAAKKCGSLLSPYDLWLLTQPIHNPHAKRRLAQDNAVRTVHMARPALLPVGTAGIVGKGCGADCVLRRLAWLLVCFPTARMVK